MRKANNLNQLLSRVKSVFGRKAMPSTTVTPNAEPPTDLSVVSDPRLAQPLPTSRNISPKTTILRQQNSAIRITPTAQVSSRKMRYSHPRSSSSRTLTASTTSPTTCCCSSPSPRPKTRTGSLKNWVSSSYSSKDSA